MRTLPLSPHTKGTPRAISEPVDTIDGDNVALELRCIQAFELTGRSHLLCRTEGPLLKTYVCPGRVR